METGHHRVCRRGKRPEFRGLEDGNDSEFRRQSPLGRGRQRGADEWAKTENERSLGSEGIVAGAPACMEELKAQGIENFIHVRVNVLDTLVDFNAKLLK